MTKIICYDLNKPGKEYEKLYEYLKSMPARQLQRSVWASKTRKPCNEIRNELKAIVDSNDSVIVVNDNGWASFNCQNISWLKE